MSSPSRDKERSSTFDQNGVERIRAQHERYVNGINHKQSIVDSYDALNMVIKNDHGIDRE